MAKTTKKKAGRSRKVDPVIAEIVRNGWIGEIKSVRSPRMRAGSSTGASTDV